MPEPNATHPSDDRLDELICEYLEAAERGSAPAQEDFVARHPEFEDELREFFSDWQGVPAPGRGNSSDTLATQHDDSDVVLTGGAIKLELEDFELVREIGRGGMGQVFEARQRSLRRNVAVKAMSLGKTSARHGRLGAKAAEKNTQELRGRFLREAEVTGGLQHPGIVPVYAVGTAADGEPYYAMRLIEGESLHDAIEAFHKSLAPGEDYSRTRSLDFRRLLRRLIDVCNAIDYAHSQHVIHRDIKPRNVMLGPFGETLVVDWGLAKHVGVGASLVDTAPIPPTQPASGTHQGSAVGTPAFMSPEQATGELDRLGPASDVYSLGATLYCLLTGKPAFEGRDLLLIFDQVKRGEFKRPREVHPGAPPALEAICLKAMALEKAQRYASATTLAEEIERWLADEPVTAYREPLLERCARWGRRHRTWLRAGALALAAVAAVATVSALLIDRERQTTQLHRDQALARLRQSRKLTDSLLTGMSESLELHPGAQSTRKYLLEQAAADHEQFVTQVEDDPELELERGRAYLRLGKVRHLLREQQAAQDAFAKAQQIFDALQNAQPAWSETRLEAANSRTNLALALALKNEDQEAKNLYHEAITMTTALLKESPNHEAYRESWSAAAIGDAALKAHQGHYDSAKIDLLDALARLKEWNLAKSTPSTTRLIANFQMLLAEVFEAEGDWNGAYTQLEEAVASLDGLAQLDSAEPATLNDRAAALVRLGKTGNWLGKADEELEAYERAREDFIALATRFYDVPLYEENRALTEVDLAQCLLLQREANRAKELLDAAVGTFRLLAALPDYPRAKLELATALDVGGQALVESGSSELGRLNFEAAAEEWSSLLFEDPDNPDLRLRAAVTKSHLAQSQLRLAGTEKLASAAEIYREAIADFHLLVDGENATPEQRYSMALAAQQCGEIFLHAENAELGGQALAEAKTQWLKLVIGVDAPAVEHLDRAARFLSECPDLTLRDGKQAMELATKALARAPENEALMTTLAAALYRAGTNQEECVALLDKAIAKRPHARAYFYLALQQADHDPETARKNLDLGAAWLSAHAPGNRELQRLREEAEQKLNPPPAAD